MTSNPLRELSRLGQSPWLDNLSRTLLRDGELERLRDEDGITGVTSNPAIFQKAIADGRHYRDDLAEIAAREPHPERRYEALVIPDVQAACAMFHDTFTRTDGDDGYVSVEVSPHLAYDADATLAEGLRLREAVGAENVLIKVPATEPGIEAIEALTARGVNVNVTLIFSLGQARRVQDAYVRGVRRWLADGGSARVLKSVASVFLSRIDTLVDARLEALGTDRALALRGRTGVALAKLAYQDYRARTAQGDFAELARLGVRPQYLLWGSTGTKNPAYSDVLYVESVIGPQTVNTMPDAALVAFRDHGRAAVTITDDVSGARDQFARLRAFDIDLEAVGEELQRAGVDLFADAFDQLLAEVGAA
jgi:transaldolase